MSKDLRAALRRAVLRLLDPLTRLLIEAGIGAGEFHQLAKESYVRVARRIAKAERQNYTQLAVLTGLTRIEVTQIAKAQQEAPDIAPSVKQLERNLGATRAERVLRGWWSDSEFQNGRGGSAILPITGRRGSFRALVERYAGGPTASAVLRELLRVKAVRQHPDHRVEAISRTFATMQWDESGVELVGERVRDLLETLGHNLQAPNRPLYTRFVVNSTVDPKYLPLLIRDFSQHADVMADSLEDQLTDPQKLLTAQRQAQAATRFGIGIFLIEEPSVVEGRAEPTKSSRKKR